MEEWFEVWNVDNSPFVDRINLSRYLQIPLRYRCAKTDALMENPVRLDDGKYCEITECENRKIDLDLKAEISAWKIKSGYC